LLLFFCLEPFLLYCTIALHCFLTFSVLSNLFHFRLTYRVVHSKSWGIVGYSMSSYMHNFYLHLTPFAHSIIVSESCFLLIRAICDVSKNLGIISKLKRMTVPSTFSSKSFNNKNNKGPSTEPWGTMLHTSPHLDHLPLIHTLCFLLLNQHPMVHNNLPLIPRSFNFSNSHWRETLSKALAKSKNTISTSTLNPPSTL